jgi:uncharacterized protein YfaS (alpha-2-macroglobulin family)
MLATAAMADVLDAFATPGRPTRQEIGNQLARDVELLGKSQLADGGWGYFQGMVSDPYVTMQVLSALVANKRQDAVTRRAASYVTKQAASLFAKLEKRAAIAAGARTTRADHAYTVSLAAAALATLASAGKDVRPRAARLHALATTLGGYPVDAKARILALLARSPGAQAIRAALVRELVSATHETASSATVTTGFSDAEQLLLVSSTKTTALALDALMREVPEHALIAKLARGVLDARRRGRWSSTQENLVVLQALRRYFNRYEKATPSFTGKLWLGSAAYAEQAFVGRSTARSSAQLAWTALAAGSSHDLALVKDGPGRMYYRVGITYAAQQAALPALDAGFVVRRSYTAVDDPRDVTRLGDGRWKIRLGAKVVVTVETINTTRRHAVAVVDPLPAGLEAVNDHLATAERSVVAPGATRWDHRNLRDQRSEAFAMNLREGTHQLTYTARATTPGTFIAAPAKAEEMYSPETFGRSASETVVVE